MQEHTQAAVTAVQLFHFPLFTSSFQIPNTQIKIQIYIYRFTFEHALIWMYNWLFELYE